jgi:hypothetical protein
VSFQGSFVVSFQRSFDRSNVKCDEWSFAMSDERSNDRCFEWSFAMSFRMSNAESFDESFHRSFAGSFPASFPRSFVERCCELRPPQARELRSGARMSAPRWEEATDYWPGASGARTAAASAALRTRRRSERVSKMT